MAERARRIDILGPAEVARAAKELAISIRRDVDLASKLMELAESQRPAVEHMTSGTLPAMTSAVEAMEEATRQMQELTAEALEDVRVPPGADAMFAAFERAEELANAAIAQAHEGNDDFAAFLDQATAIVAELKSNQEAREGIRERFTTAARHTLDSATP
ncbi:hypothetical protein TN53_24135 [Streptomyces sp. WM6386]|nr:hypothetical protein TN53_24135 [Streptomyces sp. WM6386]